MIEFCLTETVTNWLLRVIDVDGILLHQFCRKLKLRSALNKGILFMRTKQMGQVFLWFIIVL